MQERLKCFRYNKKWKVKDYEVRIMMEDELLMMAQFSPYST